MSEILIKHSNTHFIY